MYGRDANPEKVVSGSEGDQKSPIRGDPDSRTDAYASLLEHQCLEELLPEHRDVLNLVWRTGETSKQIARELQQPHSTVRTWIAKAKRIFHDCYFGVVQ